MPFLTRYSTDSSRPRVRRALLDLTTRAVAPAVVLWLVIVGIGMVITGPLGDAPAEDGINRAIQRGRTPTWDSVTSVWSHIGNTEIIIGVCVVLVAVIWWRTRQWWVAVIPAIAIALQATIFVIASAVTDRQRPEVEHLDPAPPTSSYPSGHVGATTALYVSLALVAQRISHPLLRRVTQVICLVVPWLVAWARLYRGMHQLSDVIVGAGNGLACAVLAWVYLRRRSSGRP